MKLQKITIIELFQNPKPIHLSLPNTETTIIHSLNGMGKTTVLNLISAIFHGDIKYLIDTVFSFIRLEFSDNYFITVTKDFSEITFPDNSPDTDKNSKRLTILKFSDNEYQNIAIDDTYLTKNNNSDFESITMESFKTSDDYYKKIEQSQKYAFDFKKFLKKIQDLLYVSIIDTDRLFIYSPKKEISKTHFSIRERNKLDAEETISYFSANLNKRIRQLRMQKELISESLDSSFPIDLLTGKHKMKEETLADNFEKLITKRKELQKLGLIENSNDLENILNSPVKKGFVPVLDLYIQNSLKKLSVYDEIYPKLELFFRIINELCSYSNKKVVFKQSKITFIVNDTLKDNDSNIQEDNNFIEIPLENLSSGEKHLFIIFYYLIFLCKDNDSLILIDEPEISMHISWQEEFINYLNEICLSKNIQSIVTTHSPNIVHNHFDQLIGLYNEDSDE